MTPVKNVPLINDTGSKIAVCINDTGEKFAIGVNDTGDKFYHQFHWCC
jgi:hypothetical protein